MPEHLFLNFGPTWVVTAGTCSQKPERPTGRHRAWVPRTILRS